MGLDQDNLPDARLSTTNRKTICGPVGIMSRVYCVNCGGPGGLVTEDWCQSIFFLCDKCAEKYGEIDGAVEVPEEVVNGQNKDSIFNQLKGTA